MTSPKVRVVEFSGEENRISIFTERSEVKIDDMWISFNFAPYVDFSPLEGLYNSKEEAMGRIVSVVKDALEQEFQRRVEEQKHEDWLEEYEWAHTYDRDEDDGFDDMADQVRCES